jgi:adenylate kinase
MEEIVCDRTPKGPLVVNLVGGPGAGKSTICAEAFAAMKWMGISCEMSLEYAKDKVWEGSLEVLSNQVYVFGKQQHRLHRLAEKVDVVITDAPLIHSIHYGNGDEALAQLVRREMSKFRQITFLLMRSDLYDPKGRTQSLDEARRIDEELDRLLEAERILPIRIEAKKGAGEGIAETVMAILKSESSKQ